MTRMLSVVALGNISKRHTVAVNANRNGHSLTRTDIDKILADMGKLIASHDEALTRIRSAQLALDPAMRDLPVTRRPPGGAP
jgi:hypothetical protein